MSAAGKDEKRSADEGQATDTKPRSPGSQSAAAHGPERGKGKSNRNAATERLADCKGEKTGVRNREEEARKEGKKYPWNGDWRTLCRRELNLAAAATAHREPDLDEAMKRTSGALLILTAESRRREEAGGSAAGEDERLRKALRVRRAGREDTGKKHGK